MKQYILPKNVEEGKEAQRLLFGQGYQWQGGHKDYLSHLFDKGDRALCFEDKKLTHSDIEYAVGHEFKKVEIKDLRKTLVQKLIRYFQLEEEYKTLSKELCELRSDLYIQHRVDTDVFNLELIEQVLVHIEKPRNKS